MHHHLVVVRVKWDYMRVKRDTVRKIFSTELSTEQVLVMIIYRK